MSLKPQLKYKLKQVLSITLWWVILGFFIELYNAVNYHPILETYYLYFPFGGNFFNHLLITAIGPVIGGLLGGAFIVFYQREKLKSKSFLLQLIFHSAIYVSFVTVCIIIVGLIGALFNLDNDNFKQNFIKDIFSLRVARLLIVWYFIVLATIFMLNIIEKFGSGFFKNLILGKYHTPYKEERFFMFLDLNSSTSIAESIGDKRYFEMLRYFYEVANNTIINYQGDIYQYIGDEIIVSWSKDAGIDNYNCLRCFNGIQNSINEKSENFIKNFGVLPDFKAAVHLGSVTAGVIGIIKRDIVFSGDILNATERILQLCKVYNQKLIISENVYQHVKEAQDYKFIPLGQPVLKGKAIKMDLFGVDVTDSI